MSLENEQVTTTSTVPATPEPPSVPPPDNAPQGQTVEVDGKVYTPDQIRRLSQQASQANKFAELGYGEAVKQGIRYEDLKKAATTPATPTTNTTSPEQFDAENFKKLIDDRVSEVLTANEHAKAMKDELTNVSNAIKSYGIDVNSPDASPIMAGIQNILNNGIPDGNGGVIPGTACIRIVDGRRVQVPATAEIIQQAVKVYFEKTIPNVSRTITQRKFGRQPDAPPETGSGAFGQSAPSKPFLRLSAEERKAEAAAFVKQLNAGGSTTSARST
jgi:hypothetical protein